MCQQQQRQIISDLSTKDRRIERIEVSSGSPPLKQGACAWRSSTHDKLLGKASGEQNSRALRGDAERTFLQS